MPLVRYKPASRSISARPRRPTAPDSPLINTVHHKYSPAKRCVARTLTLEPRTSQNPVNPSKPWKTRQPPQTTHDISSLDIADELWSAWYTGSRSEEHTSE